MKILFRSFTKFCLVLLPQLVLGNLTEHNSIEIVSDVTELSWEAWCKLQPNGYDCANKGLVSKFYYDLKLQDCKTAKMGTACVNNINRFNTITECHDACNEPGEHIVREKVTAKVYCRYQPDFGHCNSYYPRFYFDLTLRQCRGFSYSGCGGNLNRFSSFQMCSAICMPVVEYSMFKKN